LAAIAIKQEKDQLKLVTISNRGTQVWPTGSVFTNLVMLPAIALFILAIRKKRLQLGGKITYKLVADFWEMRYKSSIYKFHCDKCCEHELPLLTMMLMCKSSV
jgi:hypothetical protein